MSSPIQKLVIVVATSFSLLFSVTSCGSSPRSESSSASKVPNPSPLKGVTMANFSQLKTGMTYAQAVKILGKDGEELSSNEISGVKTIMYKWDGNSFASNMNAMFQNGKLISKAQMGLK